MNMLDVLKTTRGVTLWREDIIKYNPVNHGGRSLSEFLRDLLHSKMGKYNLSSDGKAELKRQVEKAEAARVKKLRRPGKLGRRLAFSEALTIPAKVRKGVKFMKGR